MGHHLPRAKVAIHLVLAAVEDDVLAQWVGEQVIVARTDGAVAIANVVARDAVRGNASSGRGSVTEYLMAPQWQFAWYVLRLEWASVMVACKVRSPFVEHGLTFSND